MLTRIRRNWNSHTLLVGMLWKIVVVPQKVELRVTIGLSNFTPTYKPNRNENKFPDKNSFMKVHSSQKVETTNESTNAWINEMWYIHMMQYHSRIKRNEVLMHSMPWMNLGFFVAVFFFFWAALWHMKLPGKGSYPSHSCNLCHNFGNADSVNPLC